MWHQKTDLWREAHRVSVNVCRKCQIKMQEDTVSCRAWCSLCSRVWAKVETATSISHSIYNMLNCKFCLIYRNTITSPTINFVSRICVSLGRYLRFLIFIFGIFTFTLDTATTQTKQQTIDINNLRGILKYPLKYTPNLPAVAKKNV